MDFSSRGNPELKAYAQFESEQPGRLFNRIGGGSEAYCACVSQNYADFTDGITPLPIGQGSRLAAAQACFAYATK